MPRVFITQPVPQSAVARLRQAADVDVFPDSSRILPYDMLQREIASCDVLYCLLHDRVDAQIIGAGKTLKLIATSAIVPANVDVAAATARGIPVTVIPNIIAETTADLQWGLLLAVARRIVEADQALRGGLFPGSQSLHFLGGDVHGQTVGTIGLGAIGTAMARRAQGFGMRVLYTKRQRLPVDQEQRLSVEYRALDELLAESDFVVVNAAYHPGTHHLIGARELSLMKPTAYLINTARGPIVDEQALVDALAGGRIAGAGLDVYEHEPRVHPGLLPLRNVVLTPHLGSAARQMRERMASVVADNILAFLRGDRPPNLHNPEVYA
ncbi:MAG: D-glycerate dehydrogenase [Armatimonadota bacterium]|nr:D-glycerate dehydrogenase [Armatimonadota bacterium]